MINFTLPVSIDFTNLLKSVNQGCTNTRTQYIMLVQCSSRAEILLHTELSTPVQYSSGVWSKIADLPNSGKRNVDTSKQYKLTNKHVTEVSQNKRNCLSESKCLEEIACLTPLYSEKQVKTYKDRAQLVKRTKENYKEENLPCELERFSLSAVVRIDCTTKRKTSYINTFL